MSSYRILFKKSAAKEFSALSKKIQEKMVEALGVLSKNPYTELLHIKKLKGVSSFYRVRIGDYRVAYEIRDDELIVTVIKIGHRKDVYRFLP